MRFRKEKGTVGRLVERALTACPFRNEVYLVVFSEKEDKTYRLILNEELADRVFARIDNNMERIYEIIVLTESGNLVLQLVRSGKCVWDKQEETSCLACL